MAKHRCMVALDPGHGLYKNDAGEYVYQRARINGIVEDEIVVDIARQCKKVLDQYVEKVWCTRSLSIVSDSWKYCTKEYWGKYYKRQMSYPQWKRIFDSGGIERNDDVRCRALLLNYMKDYYRGVFDHYILVSIHTNGHGDGTELTSANGVEAWIDEDQLNGEMMANNVMKKLLFHSGMIDRGVKTIDDKYAVLRDTTYDAACIAECGFHTGNADNISLHDFDFRKKLGRAVAEGVILTVRELERG